MSLIRTALRIATIAAFEANPTIAALCPGRVYDSLIDNLDARDPVPVIVIFTEDHSGHAFSANNGGLPFRGVCDLLIEISMRVQMPDPTAPADASIVIGIAETDAEAEIALDLLEDRAIFALTEALTPQTLLLRNAVTRRVMTVKSVRFSSAESGAKIALRTITVSVELKNPEPDDIFDLPTGEFASLPEPLRSVAAAQPEGSDARATCLSIAAQLPSPLANIAPMTGVDFTFAPTALQAVNPAIPPSSDDEAETFKSDCELAE